MPSTPSTDFGRNVAVAPEVRQAVHGDLAGRLLVRRAVDRDDRPLQHGRSTRPPLDGTSPQRGQPIVARALRGDPCGGVIDGADCLRTATGPGPGGAEQRGRTATDPPAGSAEAATYAGGDRYRTRSGDWRTIKNFARPCRSGNTV